MFLSVLPLLFEGGEFGSALKKLAGKGNVLYRNSDFCTTLIVKFFLEMDIPWPWRGNEVLHCADPSWHRDIVQVSNDNQQNTRSETLTNSVGLVSPFATISFGAIVLS